MSEFSTKCNIINPEGLIEKLRNTGYTRNTITPAFSSYFMCSMVLAAIFDVFFQLISSQNASINCKKKKCEFCQLAEGKEKKEIY